MNHGIDTGFLVAAEVAEHLQHHQARARLEALISAGDGLALAPQVIVEFIHIVTDPKRFTAPLTMNAARDLAQKWWAAREIMHVVPNDAAMQQFFAWHRNHGLGRKRLLDTLLASTYLGAGITSILTTNPNDFVVLGPFQLIVP